jgi:hypothetical protein
MPRLPLALALTLSACGSNPTTPGDGHLGDGHPPDAGVFVGASVLQHHLHPTRDGVYVDPALTHAAVATLHVDPTFVGTVAGPTYAQPLFVDGGPGGHDLLVVATERNVVYALDAATGAARWQTPPLGEPVALGSLPCGNIDPLGITGTPYIDLATRTIYLDAMTTPDGGTTKRHRIFALSLDDGTTRAGWPVDVEAKVATFDSSVQNQRGALVVLDGVLYVPYGGHYGDCGAYHGWLVGVDVTSPATVHAWKTPADGGGAWASAGVSTDGTSLYVTTGNTFGATTWAGGDAVIRLAKGPTFSGLTKDYFAPVDWPHLDATDLDLGTHLLVDVPGVTPSALILAGGKDGKLSILDRANLGGVGHPLATIDAANGELTGGATTYATPQGTFVAFRVDGAGGRACPSGQGGNLLAMKLAPGPTATTAWCSSAYVSIPATSMSTAAGADPIVWAMSADQLYAQDGETGAVLFGGGAATDQMTSGVRYFQTPIIAKGRVYVPANDRLYAFTP